MEVVSLNILCAICQSMASPPPPTSAGISVVTSSRFSARSKRFTETTPGISPTSLSALRLKHHGSRRRTGFGTVGAIISPAQCAEMLNGLSRELGARRSLPDSLSLQSLAVFAGTRCTLFQGRPIWTSRSGQRSLSSPPRRTNCHGRCPSQSAFRRGFSLVYGSRQGIRRSTEQAEGLYG